MPLALPREHQKAVEAVRRFANLQRVDSDEQVERCFRGLIDLRDALPVWIDPKTGREKRAVISTDLYTDLQSILRGWLGKIARSTRGQREVAGEIAEVLVESVDTSTRFDNRRLTQVYSFKSVGAACAFGVALILDERHDLASRLKQCGWSKCGHFNLDLNPKGRPRRFCSPEHKRLADLETVAERVRKYRENQP